MVFIQMVLDLGSIEVMRWLTTLLIVGMLRLNAVMVGSRSLDIVIVHVLI
jgi:hypothetical protein